jgi:hypothetical protein
MECGQYVETHEPHNNSMNERTCPAIFLRTNGNAQGGAYFMSLRTGQQLNRQGWTVLPMPDGVVSTVHNFLAKTSIVGLPFQNRRREPIEVADVDDDPASTGVIDEEPETDNDNDDTDEDDDNDDDDSMPGLQERNLYDSDSDDKDEEEDDDDEQSAGVLDDDEQSTGVLDTSAEVEVETVEEEEAEVPNVKTKGVPKHNQYEKKSKSSSETNTPK